MLHVPKRCNWRCVESRACSKPRRTISLPSGSRVRPHGCGSCWQCSSWLVDVLDPSLGSSLYRLRVCVFLLSRCSQCLPLLNSSLSRPPSSSSGELVKHKALRLQSSHVRIQQIWRKCVPEVPRHVSSRSIGRWERVRQDREHRRDLAIEKRASSSRRVVTTAVYR